MCGDQPNRPADGRSFCASRDLAGSTETAHVTRPRCVRNAPASRGVDAGSAPSAQYTWLASKQDDVETERRELERLLVADPADPTAVDRLVQLAEQDGQPARAAELRRKKGEIDRLRARYEQLYERKQPIRDVVEMAKLAERLGREFEAAVFSPWRSRTTPTASICGTTSNG